MTDRRAFEPSPVLISHDDGLEIIGDDAVIIDVTSRSPRMNAERRVVPDTKTPRAVGKHAMEGFIVPPMRRSRTR